MTALKPPLRMGVIGAGAHSRENHLPSLALYQREHPGQVALVAVCDLDAGRASRAAAQFGFEKSYFSIDTMLDEARLDACVAVTPMEFTAECALRLIARGLPCLIEKPPGVTLEQARAIAAAAENRGVPVMVSLNRRHDPALLAAVRWRSERRIRYVRSVISRARRREEGFVRNTAIHAFDAMRALAGEIGSSRFEWQEEGEAPWVVARLVFECGALGTFEALPTAGANQERHELYGDGWRLEIRGGYGDAGEAVAFEDRAEVFRFSHPPGTPAFVRNGSHGETREFVTSLLEGRAPYPTPAQTLPSLETLWQGA